MTITSLQTIVLHIHIITGDYNVRRVIYLNYQNIQQFLKSNRASRNKKQIFIGGVTKIPYISKSI